MTQQTYTLIAFRADYEDYHGDIEHATVSRVDGLTREELIERIVELQTSFPSDMDQDRRDECREHWFAEPLRGDGESFAEAQSAMDSDIAEGVAAHWRRIEAERVERDRLAKLEAEQRARTAIMARETAERAQLQALLAKYPDMKP